MDIMKVFLDKLKEANKRIELFFDTHFEFTTESSLVPVHSREGIEFPTKTYITPKSLSIKEKLEYYLKDLELFLGELDEKEIQNNQKESKNMDS